MSDVAIERSRLEGLTGLDVMALLGLEPSDEVCGLAVEPDEVLVAVRGTDGEIFHLSVPIVGG